MSYSSYGTDFVLRPRTRLRRNALLWMAVICLVLGGIAGAAAGDVAVGAIVAGFCAALALPSAVLILVYYRRGRIAVTATEIEVVGLVTRRRFPRSDITELVRADLIAPRTPVFGNIFFLDRHGTARARVITKYYTAEDLQRLIEHLRLPVSGPPRPVTANMLAEQYPNIVWFGERRPFAFAFIVAGVVVVALFIVAGILSSVMLA